MCIVCTEVLSPIKRSSKKLFWKISIQHLRYARWTTSQLLVTEVCPNRFKAISLQTLLVISLEGRNARTDRCCVSGSTGLIILILRRRIRKCDHAWAHNYVCNRSNETKMAPRLLRQKKWHARTDFRVSIVSASCENWNQFSVLGSLGPSSVTANPRTVT